MGFFDLDHQPEQTRVDVGPDPPWEFRTRSVPPLFLVCRESHRIAKEKIYQKSFGSPYGMPRTWFNFEVDTLYLDWGYYVYDDDDDDDDDTIEFQFFPEVLSEDVKKVQHLAIYSGKHPDSYLPAQLINDVLSKFGHVQNLLLALPDYKHGGSADLVFLEWDDVMDDPAYSEEFHPVVDQMFPDVENKGNLWVESNHLWHMVPYSDTMYLDHNQFPQEKPEWPIPNLSGKPIIIRQQKLDLFRRKQEYNKERETEVVTIILTAEKFNSLEVVVPWRTTVAELVSMFCQARAIDVNLERDSIDTVFIYDESHRDTQSSGDCEGFSLECNVYEFRTNEITRLDLYFDCETIEHSCSCDSIYCAHTEKYKQMLWMESEDWGVRDLFETFAFDKAYLGN
jgi:hypothetical protein